MNIFEQKANLTKIDKIIIEMSDFIIDVDFYNYDDQNKKNIKNIFFNY